MLIAVYVTAIVGGMGLTLWQAQRAESGLVAEVRELRQEQVVLDEELEAIKNSPAQKIIVENYRTEVLLPPKLSEVKNQPPAAAGNLPESGYARVAVTTDRGVFTVSAVVAPGARVVVETAGEGDCADNCPTLPLAQHIANSGGFAGINGSYFCPPDYAQCQGKTNSFDTLAVNGRTKAVINRANNVYSVVPLLAAYGGTLSFYDRTVDWGVDTGSSGAIANYPRLVRGGSAANGEENGKGTRGFIGVKNGAVVIGHVFGASFGDAAAALASLGLQEALNLDGGGSSALWYEGSYRVGPGRNLPTAVVLAR